MSYGLGPGRIDFSPLAQLGDRFFDAYDKAKLQAYSDQAVKLYERELLSSLAPKPAAPAGVPIADAGSVPDVLGTPKMRPAAPSFAAVPAPGLGFGPGAGTLPAGASGRTMVAPGAAVDPVAADLPAHQRALLNGIAGPESGGKYNIRYTPGGGTTFAGFDRHPGLYAPGPAGPSSAAGRYQFVKSTWDKLVGAGTPFTPENQDRAAIKLAQQDYQRRTGRDLDADLRSEGLTPRIAAALGPTWAGLKANPKKAIQAYNESYLRYAGDQPQQVAQNNVPLPRQTQVASADPNFMPPPSAAMARVQQEAEARGLGQGGAAPPAPSRAGQFLTARAQNAAGLPTAGAEGDPATPSDFVPGSTAVPAQPPQYGQPAPGAQPVGATPTGLSLLSQAQKDNLRAMLANPVTRPHAMQLIDKLNTPEQFEIKEAGGQFYRIGKTTGQAQIIPGIAKPQEWTPFQAPDGNSYLVNKHTGQTKRLIEGSKFQDVTNPSELAALRPASYQGPVQRDKEGQIVYPGSGIHAADQRVDVTDPAELARVRPAGYTGPVQRGKNGELYFPGAGAAGINLQSAGDAAAQTARIKQFEKTAEQGDAARKAAVDIENLRELGRSIGPAGATAGLKEALGPYAQAAGIEIKGLSDIQAYQSIIKRLTPQMRQPGSGSSSNLDVQMFEKALPGLLMHPDGREMVLDVMRAGNDYEADKAAIAQAALNTEANGGISHAEAARRMRALEEPIQRFKEFRANNPTVVRDALQAKTPQAGPPSAQNPPRKVSTKDEFDKLPSGTPFIAADDPKGSVRVKP